MKNFLCLILCVLVCVPASANSEQFGAEILSEVQTQVDTPDQSRMIAKSKKRRRSSKRKSSKRSSRKVDLLAKAKSLAVSKKYEESSKLLFSLTRSARYRADRSQIKYILGLMLMEMGLYQVASFVFYDVISSEVRKGKTTKYLRQSLGKLSFLSNALDSDVLLKYTISKIKVKDFPREQKDLFYLRLGELRLKEGRNKSAAKVFSRVEASSPVYPQALYKKGLAWAETKSNNGRALDAFDELLNISKKRGITDDNRVNAVLSKARIYYQAKKWEKAVDLYRDIPRDTWQWHDSLFEQSWAMFRSGRYFRSAMSNFHTLHSPYYSDVWNPESLLLRSIVYLFICRYDEMNKTLALYDRIYKPVEKKIKRFMSSASDKTYLNEVAKAEQYAKLERKKENPSWNTRLPKIVLRQILRQPSIRRNLNYTSALDKEMKLLNRLSSDWRRSGIGKYAKRVISKRIKSTDTIIGKQAKNYLRTLSSDLRDFDEQGEFLKLERVRGQRLSVKKEIAGKNLKKKQITEDDSRSYFIKNGFEYWPYKGEYWLDELGNYHYVGVSACE